MYGSTSLDSICKANHSLAEMPELRGHNKVIHAMHVAKKPSEQNRRSNSQRGNIKYRVRISHCIKEALQYDNANSNDLWKNAIIKEVSELIRHHIFWFLKETCKQLKKGGCHFAPLRMIF